MQVTTIHERSPELDAQIAKVLPHLRTMKDADAVEAIGLLYQLAFDTAFETSSTVIKELSECLCKIIKARHSGSTEDLIAAVDAFITENVIVKEHYKPTPTN